MLYSHMESGPGCFCVNVVVTQAPHQGRTWRSSHQIVVLNNRFDPMSVAQHATPVTRAEEKPV